MPESEHTTETNVAPRRGRAWWQWVLGIGFLGAAGYYAAIGYIPGLRKPGLPFEEPPELRVSPELEPAESVPAEPGDLAGYNLILVSFDTTRADFLGCYGNEEVETPTLDRLATEGVLFSDAMAPGSTTLPSHSTMLTGRYPYHHGARANAVFRLAETETTLAEVLKEAGYATGAAVSAFVIASQSGTSQGFEDFDDNLPEAVSLGMSDGLERYADQSTDVAIDWLRNHADDKTFFWLHYFDPHAPYNPPPPFDEKYDLAYKGEIAFADSQLGRLVEAVEEMGLTDKTLFVIVGDHGEALGQHGEITHGMFVYDETVRVPFIMRCGDRFGGVHVDRQVSLVDLMPTALSLLGVTAPEGVDGIDLTQPIPQDRAVFLETMEGLMEWGWAAPIAARGGSLKYIHSTSPEVYERANDPYERKNLYGEGPKAASDLKRRLEAFYDNDLTMAMTVEPTEELTPEEAAKIAALGYVQALGGDLPAVEDRPDPREALPLKLEAELAMQPGPDMDVDRAIDRLQDFLQDHPDNYAGLRYLGEAYLKNKEFEKAAEALEKCLRQRPRAPYAVRAFIRAKIQTGDLDGARVVLDGLLTLYPDQVPVMSELARVLMHQQKPQEAYDILERALRLEPGNRNVLAGLMIAMSATGQGERTEELLAEQLAANPKLHFVRSELAALRYSRGDYAGAIQILREGVQAYPHQLEMVNNLALFMADSPDPDVWEPTQAVLLIERACRETDFGDPEYLRTLAFAYSRTRRVDEAISVTERAVRLAQQQDRAELAAVLQADLERYREAKAAGASPMQGIPRPPSANQRPGAPMTQPRR